jgi:hypothetical protein
MEDDLHFFYGRWPQISLKMEDDLKNSKIGRRPQIYLKMEDDLNLMKMEDDLNFVENGRLPPIFWKRKTTSTFFEKGRRPLRFWKWKTISNIFQTGRQRQMFLYLKKDLKYFDNENYLNFYETRIQPQTNQNNQKQLKSEHNGCGTAPGKLVTIIQVMPLFQKVPIH